MLKRDRKDYIPLGVTQQGRLVPTKQPTVDPDLLLAQGSMTGPYRHTHPINRWTWMLRRAWRAVFGFRSKA